MSPLVQDENGDPLYVDPQTYATYEVDPDDEEHVRAVGALLEAEAAAEQANHQSAEDVDLRDQFLEEKEEQLGRRLTAAEVQKFDAHVSKHDELPEEEWTHDLDTEEGRQAWMTEAATRPAVGGFAAKEGVGR